MQRSLQKEEEKLAVRSGLGAITALVRTPRRARRAVRVHAEKLARRRSGRRRVCGEGRREERKRERGGSTEPSLASSSHASLALRLAGLIRLVVLPKRKREQRSGVSLVTGSPPFFTGLDRVWAHDAFSTQERNATRDNVKTLRTAPCTYGNVMSSRDLRQIGLESRSTLDRYVYTS